ERCVERDDDRRRAASGEFEIAKFRMSLVEPKHGAARGSWRVWSGVLPAKPLGAGVAPGLEEARILRRFDHASQELSVVSHPQPADLYFSQRRHDGTAGQG